MKILPLSFFILYNNFRELALFPFSIDYINDVRNPNQFILISVVEIKTVRSFVVFAKEMDLLRKKVYNDSKPYHGFKNLLIGNYKIVRFRMVMNRYYRPGSENPGLKKTLLVELEDQILFLPEYITAKFSGNKEEILQLNEDNKDKKLFLCFNGKRDTG